jgi:hypothetical protein
MGGRRVMTVATAEQEEKLRQMDALYEQYGKPLETKHWGEFVAIAPDGRSVLAPTVLEAAELAEETLGRGVFLFKVGEKVVFKWL